MHVLTKVVCVTYSLLSIFNTIVISEILQNTIVATTTVSRTIAGTRLEFRPPETLRELSTIDLEDLEELLSR